MDPNEQKSDDFLSLEEHHQHPEEMHEISEALLSVRDVNHEFGPVAETILLSDYLDVEPLAGSPPPADSNANNAQEGVNHRNNADDGLDRRFASDPRRISSLVRGSGETLLARELAKISTTEREAVLNDIHGVSEDEAEETQVFVSQKLSEMDVEIQQLRQELPEGRTAAYSQAEATSSRYVKDADFRLMFLRASHFDVKQAATRLLGHFEKKLELFGPFRLTKTITLDDLDVDDNDCLKSGQSQVLPYRDRSGRAIFFQDIAHYKYKEVINALRAVYYLLMSALEDEETQRRGVVCVVYNVEPKSPHANDPNLYINVYQMLPKLPIRMMGAHYCVQDSDLRLFMSSIRVAMSREVRLRSRVHCGSHQECIYTLMTFGVPRKCFPITSTGELLVEKHGEFLEMRRKQEAGAVDRTTPDLSGALLLQHLDAGSIIVPKNSDVLLGRGRPFQEHTGNMRCNFVVIASMEKYEQVSRNDKTSIARDVIAKIKAYGGRFLKQIDRAWVEVDDSEALRKISHSFRTHRQLLKVQQNGGSGNTGSNHNSLEAQQDSIPQKRQRE